MVSIDVGNSSVIMDGTSYLTNKFAFDGFNTATGRTINVHPNSLIRAKKLLDSIEVEPETVQKQFSVSDELKISLGRIPLVNNKNEKSVGSMRLSESWNDLKGPYDKRLLHFSAVKNVNFDSSRDEALKKLVLNSSERIADSRTAESCVKPLPSFSTASGKKMSVSEKSLEKAKKIYESTAEETADEIKLKGLGDDRSLRVSSCGPKTATEIGAQKLNENGTFEKPFANPMLSNVFEVESCPRCPQPAIGNKLMAKENSAGCVEKLRSLPSKETSEVAPNLRFASFSSASGKEIAVTGTSLEKAKKIFESTLEATSLCSSDENNIGVQKSVPLASFKKAEGEELHSEEALRKTKKWLECISDNLIEEKIESVETNPKQLLPASDFATRKKTRVGEVSRESKNWSVPASEETLRIGQDQEFSKFPSFSTARGKKLMVTESSLRKAEKLYATTAEEAVKSEENLSGPFLNFKSESGKKPQAFSADAPFASTAESSCAATHQSPAFSRSSDNENVLETASKSTNNVEQSASDDFLCRVDFAQPHSTQFAGFSTASGKKVNVSERSLKNAEKLYDAVAQETGEKIEASGQNLPYASSASGRKLTVGEESLRSGQKLLDDCSDKVPNESAMGPGVQPQLSTFCSEAGKTINVAQKYLLNAQKLFQSVSDETLEEDLAPRNSNQGKVQFNSKPCDTAPSLRLKRSLNEDAIHNVASSNVGKKMKTDENAMKLSAKEIILEPGEENLEITPPKRGVGLRISCSVAEKHEKRSTVSTPVQLTDASELLVDSSSMCSDENMFRKISSESSLENTILLNDDTGLRNADTKEFSEIPTSVSEICESNSTKKEIATDDSALLNLSQEISESTSAFLFDMKNGNIVFGDEQSPSYADEQKTERASRSPSPIFDSNKPGRKKKYKKRRSQYSLSLNPLDVTYVRKDSENASVRETGPEEVLKMLNKNFAQKVNKRKEPASNLVYPSSKKTKDSNKNEDFVEQQKQALLEQEKLVSHKDGQLCKPRVGSILTEKLQGSRKSLREMVNCERPQRYSVSKVNF